MERVARKLANNIALSLEYDQEKEDVIAYGLIAIIQISITIFLIGLFGWLFNCLIETLLVCFCASFLRKYSGGAHAFSAELCTIESVILCVGFAFLSKYYLSLILSRHFLPTLMAIIYFISFIVIYLYAPIDSVNKPIRTEEKKRRMRRGSFVIIFSYLFLTYFFLFLSDTYVVFFSYVISMLFGVCWQIFTLTPLGSLLIGKINNIVNLGKEGQR